MTPRVATVVGSVLLIALALVLPALVGALWLNRVAQFMTYGILGVAMAIAWGYAGILNLGQGLYFGIGAYMLAMSLKLAAPGSLEGGTPMPIPDFMLWNAAPGAPQDLCCITPGSFLWIPFQREWFGVLMGLVVPAVVALGIGYTMFRARVSGVYVAIITLALALLARLVLINAQPVTNGFNGLTSLSFFTVGGIEFNPYQPRTYYLVVLVLALSLVLAQWLVSSRAGLILQAIRDDENRTRYLGYNVASYQVFFFVVSAVLAGAAGMLYVVTAQFASPTFLDVAFSLSMVVWAAVGGRNSVIGAALGAIGLSVLSSAASETPALLNAWQLLLGAIFIVAVLFLPRGLAGAFNDLLRRRAGPDAREDVVPALPASGARPTMTGP